MAVQKNYGYYEALIMPTTIHVALAERSYDIEISRGNLNQVASFISQRRKCSRAAIITDENVGPLFAKTVVESLATGGIRADVLSVPAGEASKSVAQAERLWLELSRLKSDRKTVVVALGGGVVGD